MKHARSRNANYKKSSNNQNSNNSTNNPKKKNKGLKIVLISFLAILVMCVFGLAMLIYFPPQAMLTQYHEGDSAVPVDKASGKANMLILGVDKDGLRTDTIILASYNFEEGTVKMLSIPRDTRMYIGNRYQKINAAHALTQNGKIKGPQGTIEAVTRLTGVPINYYIEFDTDAFRNTIDAFGGLEFDVPQRMYYSDPSQDLYIDLQKGKQHLDGKKAEQLVRFRRYPEGDIGRVKMQQAFVKEFAKQKLTVTTIPKIPDIFGTLQEEFDTNLTVAEVARYIPNLNDFSSENITMYQLPGDFSGGEYEASYWICNVEELKKLIEEEFGYDADSATTGPKGQKYTGQDKVTKTLAPESPTTSDEPESSPKASNSPSEKPTQKPSEEPILKPSADTDDKPEETSEPTEKPTPDPSEEGKTDDTIIID